MTESAIDHALQIVTLRRVSIFEHNIVSRAGRAPMVGLRMMLRPQDSGLEQAALRRVWRNAAHSLLRAACEIA